MNGLIDGMQLPDDFRRLLRPGEKTSDHEGRAHTLPRYFIEIASWEEAKQRKITSHFTYAELLVVDCRESDTLLNTFPHYIPCAVRVLAQYLERFREAVGEPVFIATNGGYRSPAHRLQLAATSPHCWACAADIYRVGDVYLDDEKSIERYRRIAEALGEEVRAKPYGHAPGETDDHLHIDIGYVNVTPGQFDEGA